ncbi:MAG: helix-turn-helix transcriptional regulator [Proteobacteria bacterium]|nr:helix-turn-helix transcriptional regulator [Pseudomonadota bacterium]
MPNQQSPTHAKPRKGKSPAHLPTVQQMMTDPDEENAYALFARYDINSPIVATAVGVVLAAQRQSVNLTPNAAANRADMSAERLRSIEKGVSQPNISTFLCLCEAIGVDPRELFNRVLTYMRYPVGYVPVRNSQPDR